MQSQGEAEAPPLAFRASLVRGLSAPEVPERAAEIFAPQTQPPEGGWPFLVVTDGDLAGTEVFDVHDTIRRLVHEGRVPPTVVIAIPSQVERNSELSARATAFADFVADVVLPAVENEVPLATAGNILGYSFGGLAAVIAGVERTDRFRGVVAMSPSLWFHRRAALQSVHRAESIPDRWWIDVGTEEGDPRDTVPYMVADTRQLRDDLVRRGLELGRDVGYYEAPGSPHAMEEAGKRMEMALAFVLGEPDCAPVALELYAFRDELAVGSRASTSVEARCDDGQRVTLSNLDVRLHAEGGAANIGADGVWRARRAGEGTLVAEHLGLRASTPVRVRAPTARRAGTHARSR